ncbi:MAG: nucleotidyl transferase AbiEii/AbiGii toxin family protein [Candidatus Nanoarchaeia archaeon]|nr:nucleotidyl transferase AbiEii/AbiGii toxin family protein [Candidatus Nanoarchaeia archaeon]
MARKELIEYLSDKLKIQRKELLEKDIILQTLLAELSAMSLFRDNFAFKGGTCLIKCYMGYYRFSEDLDFTCLNQKEFSGKSEKEIRRILSGRIDKIADAIEGISEKSGLEFKNEKHNRKYIELGGSNKFVTFKLWHFSEILGVETFVKIQISFVEDILFKPKEAIAASLIEKGHEKEINFLFPEYSFLLKLPRLKVYDLKEIAAEKARAILTRRGIKARDFVDLFILSKEKGIEVFKLKKEILHKTKFMLKYRKYSDNLLSKDFSLDMESIVSEEEKLMLKPLGKDFEAFLKELKPFLEGIILELKENKQRKPAIRH